MYTKPAVERFGTVRELTLGGASTVSDIICVGTSPLAVCKGS